MTTARIIQTFLACASILLVACGQSSLRLHGRVIPGRAAVSSVVASDDERLLEPGVPGVEVAMLRDSGPRGGGLITKTTTDEFGDFEIILGRGQHPGGAVMIRVTGDDIFDARSRTFLPSAGQKLLCPVIVRSDATD